LEIVEGRSNPYSMFIYAIRSALTRDYYLRRLRRFFDFINLEKERTIEERCNLFADRGKTDPNWAFNRIMGFLQFQKERVEKREITGATLRNFVKAIKLFWRRKGFIITVLYNFTIYFTVSQVDAIIMQLN
jgi:hypothetical protein